MGKNVDESPGAGEIVESSGSAEETDSKKREINSWDRSSSAANDESAAYGKDDSDWDGSSECRETLVEPFREEEPRGKRECDEGGCEAGGRTGEGAEGAASPKGGQGKSASRPGSSVNSLDVSTLDVSPIDRSSLFEVFNAMKEKKSKIYCLSKRKSSDDMRKEEEEEEEEDSLLVEDIEEFLKEESGRETPGHKGNPARKRDGESGGRESNRTEGTPDDDTTIWMIAESERSPSTASNDRLLSVSEKTGVGKPDGALDHDSVTKKAKSSSNVRKREKKSAQSSGSDRSKRSDVKKVNLSNLLMSCEGSNFRADSEIGAGSRTKKRESCDEAGVYFTEYECRTMTMGRDAPAETETGNGVGERTETTAESGPANSDSVDARDNRGTRNDAPRNHNLILAGPSNQTSSMEVVSLPDIVGRNSAKERSAKEKLVRKANGPAKAQPAMAIRKTNESWFLLDETGQYQAVTKDEVMILLNGRSADAVLQTHKEHLIPNSTLPDTTSQNSSLAGLLMKESIQNILREEDIGGEGPDKKPIDLERKVENTLLYIQPGINLTASIKIIPVDTEMIHIWRRTRDNGSLLSSDVDLRIQSSQDSVENANQRHANRCDAAYDHHNVLARRMTLDKPQQTVREQDENSAAPESANEKPPPVDAKQENPNPDYSKLLIETRNILDNLTNSFKLLQNRLDGETNRSMALQSEVRKLRQLLREPGGMTENENLSREILRSRNPPSNESSYSSISTVQPSEKTPLKNESIVEEPCEEFGNAVETMVSTNETSALKLSRDETMEKFRTSSDFITVNIYTSEENWSAGCNPTGVQETNSLLQTNLGIIEGKMKRLEQENDFITKQNSELKKKLKEISLELEKYLASATDADACIEEEKDTDTLRDQVCNLKLELDNLKKSAKKQERELKKENNLIREKLDRNLIYLEEWFETNQKAMRELENSKIKLRESGILWEKDFDLEDNFYQPEKFLCSFNSFINGITDRLIAMENEKFLTEKTKSNGKERDCCKKSDKSKEATDSNGPMLKRNKSKESFRKGAQDSREQVMEDYFAIIVEKASLMEEIKILKTENEMATQSQMEQHEKLKQTMMALKETKNEIINLKSTQKLSEEEKNKLVDVLKMYEEQKINVEKEISDKNSEIENLLEEKKHLLAELMGKSEKLKEAAQQMKNFENSCRLKDDLIDELKVTNAQLLRMEEVKKNQIEAFKKEKNDLEMQRTQLESEMTSTKTLMNESHREMTEYINHLETIVNNTQDALEKNKQKLKDTNQSLSRLKTENESLNKQYQCDFKLWSKTKAELEECNGKLLSMSSRFREADEERGILREKLTNSERRLSEALDSSSRQCRLLQSENDALKEKAEAYSKDRDDSLKEQKELINKYATLSKELEKLQEKYRYVKIECNERTNVIRYLEMMLKESMVQYNKKIIYLENNVNHILEKIAACKNTMMENNVGIDAEVQELRQQLDVTFEERKQLENTVKNYYFIMKHLENEVQVREKEVDELNVKLSRERQKTMDKDRGGDRVQESVEKYLKSSEILKIEQLEKEISRRENELSECKKKLKEKEINHENEKKKLELTIADLRSDINRYQVRIEVMMKNLTNCNKNFNGHCLEKKNSEEMTKKLQDMNKEIEEKNKNIVELKEIINKCRIELKMKENELENSKKKNFCISETLKNSQIQVSKMQNALLATNKNNEKQQREKNEVAEKLLQSFKIIMDEKSARQAIEIMAAEKEKSFKEQLDLLKNELEVKIKNYSTLSDEINEKQKIITKLQHELKKTKSEVTSLKTQVTNYKKMNSLHLENESNFVCKRRNNEGLLPKSNSLEQIKLGNLSPERLESCMKELKEARDVNLLLRKSEGEYRAKIVRLEDEIRDARLLIKELEGSVRVEKKSKKAIKNMLMSAKVELHKCLTSKQIHSTVADKISRHLDADEIESRGLRLPQRLSSPET